MFIKNNVNTFMKLLFSLAFVSIILISCVPQVQLITVKSTNKALINNDLVYQDSLVKISYYLYSPNGILLFRIRNCSAKPIFIDWKNSMYIVSNDKRYSYWNDESNIVEHVHGANIQWTSWISTTNGTIQGQIKKPERITFLPPSTEIEISKYAISDGKMFNMNGTTEIITEKNNWKKTKKPATILHCSYDIKNTPLNFRNYITVSLTEDFKQPNYYDFGFWISDIHKMNIKQLVGDFFYIANMDSTQINSKYHPYKSPNRFFISDK